MRTSIAVSLTVLLLGACGAPSESARPRDVGTLGERNSAVPTVAPTVAPIDLGDIDDDAEEIDPAVASGFLVWTRDADGRTLTSRLDRTGREVQRLDGIFIATTQGSWRWGEQVRSVTTYRCERYDDEGAMVQAIDAQPGAATRAALVLEKTSTEQVIVEPPADGDGAYDFQQSVELVGSVGRYLFVRRSTYVDACGAHGITSMWSMIWDAARGSEVVLPDDMPFVAGARADALRALTQDEDGFPASEGTMALSEIVPRFDTDGALRPVLQFTAPTCYACTRGGGGSYTKSAFLPASALPELLAPYERAPHAVRTFLAAHRGIELGGWSALP